MKWSKIICANSCVHFLEWRDSILGTSTLVALTFATTVVTAVRRQYLSRFPRQPGPRGKSHRLDKPLYRHLERFTRTEMESLLPNATLTNGTPLQYSYATTEHMIVLPTIYGDIWRNVFRNQNSLLSSSGKVKRSALLVF
jgi:hypothetical protein